MNCVVDTSPRLIPKMKDWTFIFIERTKSEQKEGIFKEKNTHLLLWEEIIIQNEKPPTSRTKSSANFYTCPYPSLCTLFNIPGFIFHMNLIKLLIKFLYRNPWIYIWNVFPFPLIKLFSLTEYMIMGFWG